MNQCVLLCFFIVLTADVYAQQLVDQVSVSIDRTEIIHTQRAGIGCNFHAIRDSLPVTDERTYAGSVWGANPDPDDTMAWSKIYSYCDWLGLDWARLGFTYSMWEPVEGKFNYEGKEMKTLCRYLDYFQRNSIDVYLQHFFQNTDWLTPAAYRSDAIQKVRSAPNDIDKFTTGLVAMLKYLIQNKGYTCIKQYGMINEPFENWSWYMKSFNPDIYESPVPAYEMLKGKLSASKLPVALTGPDVSLWIGHPIQPQTHDVFKTFDAFDFHQYLTRYDWYLPDHVLIEGSIKCQLDKMTDTEKMIAEWKQAGYQQGNKPVYISEMGTFAYGFDRYNANVTSYVSLLKDAESVLRYSNIGVDGFARWNFVNQGNLDGPWQMINTWDAVNNRMLPEDAYTPNNIPFFTWGILSRYTAKHSNILHTAVLGGKINSIQRVFATTFQSPHHKNISLYLLNDADVPFEVSVSGLPQHGIVKYELTDENISSLSLNHLNAMKVKSQKGFVKVQLPARSVTLLTTFDLPGNMAGIVID